VLCRPLVLAVCDHFEDAVRVWPFFSSATTSMPEIARLRQAFESRGAVIAVQGLRAPRTSGQRGHDKIQVWPWGVRAQREKAQLNEHYASVGSGDETLGEVEAKIKGTDLILTFRVKQGFSELDVVFPFAQTRIVVLPIQRKQSRAFISGGGLSQSNTDNGLLLGFLSRHRYRRATRPPARRQHITNYRLRQSFFVTRGITSVYLIPHSGQVRWFTPIGSSFDVFTHCGCPLGHRTRSSDVPGGGSGGLTGNILLRSGQSLHNWMPSPR
jgi:hypothetical protein